MLSPCEPSYVAVERREKSPSVPWGGEYCLGRGFGGGRDAEAQSDTTSGQPPYRLARVARGKFSLAIVSRSTRKEHRIMSVSWQDRLDDASSVHEVVGI